MPARLSACLSVCLSVAVSVYLSFVPPFSLLYCLSLSLSLSVSLLFPLFRSCIVCLCLGFCFSRSVFFLSFVFFFTFSFTLIKNEFYFAACYTVCSLPFCLSIILFLFFVYTFPPSSSLLSDYVLLTFQVLAILSFCFYLRSSYHYSLSLSLRFSRAIFSSGFLFVLDWKVQPGLARRRTR